MGFDVLVWSGIVWCGGVVVWFGVVWCGGVAVWRCGGVAVWRCGGVVVWWWGSFEDASCFNGLKDLRSTTRIQIALFHSFVAINQSIDHSNLLG